MNSLISTELLAAIRTVLTQARRQLQKTVNDVMVKTYWEVGRLIVEDEQGGQKRAGYGQQQIKTLSTQLIKEFGKGFDQRNLRNMRAFYLTYPIWNTVCAKLSWSHYRRLLRVENKAARDWYMNEAIEQVWSVRALDRQINKFYYERLLASQDKTSVRLEAAKYSVLKDSKQIFASKYLPYLPTEEELQRELERERLILSQLPEND